MPCPACTNRLLCIFTHDTAIVPLFSVATSVPHRLLWSHQIRAFNKYTTSTRTYLTREGKHQQNIGLAYSQKRLSDDDYLPFITDAPSPLSPPLNPSSVMGRKPSRAAEAVKSGVLEIPEEFMKARRSVNNYKGMSKRATFMQAISELDESCFNTGREDKRVQDLSTFKKECNNEEGITAPTVPTTDYPPSTLGGLHPDRLDTHGSGKPVCQIAHNMEQVELEIATLPADMPVRGTLPPSFTPRAKRTDFEPMPKPPRTRAQYTNKWDFTPFLRPNGNPHKPCDQPFIMKSVGGPNHTINSILESTKKHSHWLVQKAALAKKFNNNPWRTYTRVSPGTVQLIKEINSVVPYTLKAYDISKKFKISVEAARRILRCKWTPTDEEKERRARKWFERGEKIRALQMERGEILTKEQRQETWKRKERRRLIKEMNLKFGLLGMNAGDKCEVQRSLGRIKWEGKIL